MLRITLAGTLAGVVALAVPAAAQNAGPASPHGPRTDRLERTLDKILQRLDRLEQRMDAPAKVETPHKHEQQLGPEHDQKSRVESVFNFIRTFDHAQTRHDDDRSSRSEYARGDHQLGSLPRVMKAAREGDPRARQKLTRIRNAINDILGDGVRSDASKAKAQAKAALDAVVGAQSRARHDREVAKKLRDAKISARLTELRAEVLRVDAELAQLQKKLSRAR